jgi:hypothetical protein
MINKGILLLLIPIAFSRIVNEVKLKKLPEKVILEDDTPVYKLPQYGEITVSGSVIAYIELDGFSKGDNVYLEFIFNNIRLNDGSMEIYYAEGASLDSLGDSKYAKSSSSSQSGSTYTYYITVKLETDCKIFAFVTPDIVSSSTGRSVTYKIRHAKSSVITIIIVVVVIIVILAVIGVLFYCYRRRKLLASYPQPNYQSQPAYQAPSAY